MKDKLKAPFKSKFFWIIFVGLSLIVLFYNGFYLADMSNGNVGFVLGAIVTNLITIFAFTWILCLALNFIGSINKPKA